MSPIARPTPYVIADLDSVGVLRSTPEDSIPDGGWTVASNIRLLYKKVLGYLGFSAFSANVVETAGRIMAGIEYLQLDGDRFLVVVTKLKTYLYSSIADTFTAIQDSSDFSGGDDDLFCMDVGFNYLLITNFKNPVRKWTGSGNISLLGGMTDCEPGSVSVKCRIIRPFNDFLMAFNTEEDGVAYPTRMRWSKRGQAEVWKNDAYGSGQAGYTDLSDSPDPTVNALKLNNFMAIYKERSIYLVSYIGLPAIFSIRGVVFNKGLHAKGSLVSLGDTHFFLGNDNFYAFNGATLTPIGDAIKDDFFAELVPSQKDRMQVAHNEVANEVWWAYPTASGGGDLDKLIIYNYKTGAWYFASMTTTAWFTLLQLVDISWSTYPDITWDDAVGSWDDASLMRNSRIVLFGDSSTNIMKITDEASRPSGAYTRSITSKQYDFKLPGMLKRLRRLQFALSSNTTVYPSVYVGTCNDVGETVVWNGPYTIDATRGGPRIDIDLTASLFTLKFESVGAADVWGLSRITAWYLRKGLR
jgi:hypothetical protein